MKKKSKQQKKASLNRANKRNKRLKATQKEKTKRKQTLSDAKKNAERKFEQHMKNLFGNQE